MPGGQPHNQQEEVGLHGRECGLLQLHAKGLDTPDSGLHTARSLPRPRMDGKRTFNLMPGRSNLCPKSGIRLRGAAAAASSQ